VSRPPDPVDESVPLFPVFLRLAGRRVLVIGAGGVAGAKIPPLLQAGAKVIVVAPAIAAGIWIRAARAGGQLELREREPLPKDFEGVDLVFLATDDSVANARYRELARQAGPVLVNAVDDPPNCDFYTGAIVDRGAVRVAISTAGRLPGLAGLLRRHLEDILPHECDADWECLFALRRRLRSRVSSSAERQSIFKKILQDIEERYFHVDHRNHG
jgi:precorrin-2 dehydrogenase/sirohydrochlorin ferrochelatase